MKVSSMKCKHFSWVTNCWWENGNFVENENWWWLKNVIHINYHKHLRSYYSTTVILTTGWIKLVAILQTILSNAFCFLIAKVSILIQIWFQSFLLKVQLTISQTSVQIMAWHQSGNKSLHLTEHKYHTAEINSFRPGDAYMLGHHWSRWWLHVCSAPSQNLFSWHIILYNHRKTFLPCHGLREKLSGSRAQPSFPKLPDQDHICYFQPRYHTLCVLCVISYFLLHFFMSI